MTYTIQLDICQVTGDEFEIVEKTCWHYANGGAWSERGDCHILSMGGSGTSGMLRFKSVSGEVFCVAMGVHNYKRWCDIVVDRSDSTAKEIHPTYYVPGGGPMLWEQRSEISKRTARGTRLTLEFTKKEGTQLCAKLKISKPLNLLSIDGGGVRGLSALIVLLILMQTVNHQRRGQDPLKPCDMFDLIGGTGTGGLIAIMLGRLRMGVVECIEEYVKLMEQLWDQGGDGPFDSTALGNFVDRNQNRASGDENESFVLIDQSRGGANEDEPFVPKKLQRCRVFVCAKSWEINAPVRLRSYKLPIATNSSATITQVAHATCAASGLFAPVLIGIRRYVDGGLGFSNPVHQVWSEAMNIWCPEGRELEPMLGCLVSIGTGNPGLEPINDLDLSKTAMRIARQTEDTERIFAEGLTDSSQKRYFRFNVEQGLHHVGLQEHERRATVEAATEDYLNAQEQTTKLRRCARMLC